MVRVLETSGTGSACAVSTFSSIMPPGNPAKHPIKHRRVGFLDRDVTSRDAALQIRQADPGAPFNNSPFRSDRAAEAAAAMTSPLDLLSNIRDDVSSMEDGTSSLNQRIAERVRELRAAQ